MDTVKLVDHFIERFGDKLGVPISKCSPEAMTMLEGYHWPGNVRELENTIERAMVLCDTDSIDVDDLPAKITEFNPSPKLDLPANNLSIKKAVYHIENVLISKALKKTGGNRTAAAKLLEISHRALLYKIKEYQITD